LSACAFPAPFGSDWEGPPIAEEAANLANNGDEGASPRATAERRCLAVLAGARLISPATMMWANMEDTTAALRFAALAELMAAAAGEREAEGTRTRRVPLARAQGPRSLRLRRPTQRARARRRSNRSPCPRRPIP